MRHLAKAVLAWSTSSAVLVMLLLNLTGRVQALGREQFGNDPIGPDVLFGPKVVALVNQPNRVYWFEVNGNPHFYFRGGNADMLNQTLRGFAALPFDQKEVILLAGSGEARSLGGEQRIPYDYCLHVPTGLRFTKGEEIADTRATLTIYINSVSRESPPDARFQQWFADLDHSEFRIRDNAARALSNAGNGARTAIHRELKGNMSPEKRRRLEGLLAAMTGTDVAQLDRPAGVRLLDGKDLFERYRKALQNREGEVRGVAAISMANATDDPKAILPDLLGLLTCEKDEYARRCLASALTRLGYQAKAALPLLRQQLTDPDPNIRNAFQEAIKFIENSKPQPKGPEELRDIAVIRAQIHAFCQAKDGSPNVR